MQQLCTVHRKILAREKLANLVNHELFTKIFPPNIHIYTENVFEICTDCSLFTKFFLANSFYLYGSPKFSRVVGYSYICIRMHTQNTPLLLAAKNGHRKVVKLLLEDVVDVSFATEDGHNCLVVAILNGHRSHT